MMTAFTIHASKDGETSQIVRIGPTVTVAKARELAELGWLVHITDEGGHQYGSDQFDELLRFDLKHPLKY